MRTLVIALFTFLSTLFRYRRSIQFQIVALRHQLNVYQRTVKRPRIGPARQPDGTNGMESSLDCVLHFRMDPPSRHF